MRRHLVYGFGGFDFRPTFSNANLDDHTPDDDYRERKSLMPRIIVHADQSDGDTGDVTLSERVVASHLRDGHYAAQLIERLTWAAIDAERLESPKYGEHPDEDGPVASSTRSRADRASGRPRTRALAGERRGWE